MAVPAHEPVVAAVDVGSNSVKMSIARQERDGSLSFLFGASETVRLGTGVSTTGRLAEDRVQAGLETLQTFADIARTHGAVRLVGVATEATRTAANGPAFLDRVREIGWEIQAISGDDEAALAFRGLALQIDLSGPVVVADIGGGSTEIIVATDGEIAFARSFTLGSGTITERFVPDDPPGTAHIETCIAYARSVVAEVPFPAGGQARLIVTGGTGEYLGFLAPNPERIAPDDIDVVLTICRGLPSPMLAARIGIQQARARVLPAGIAIVRGLCDLIEPSEVEVAQSGIRHGLLLATFDELAGR